MKARRSAPAPCALPVGSSEQPRAMTPRARRAGPRFAAGPIVRGPQPRGRLRVNRALRPEQTLPILAPTCRPSNTTGPPIGGLTRGLQTRLCAGGRRRSTGSPARPIWRPIHEPATSAGDRWASRPPDGSTLLQRPAVLKPIRSAKANRAPQPRAGEGPAPCHRQPSLVSWSPRFAQRPGDVLSLMLLGESTGMVSEKLAQCMSHGLLGIWIQARLHQALQLSRHSVWQFHFQRLHDRSVGCGFRAVKSRNPFRSKQL